MSPEQRQMLSAPSDAYSAGAWCELANDLAAENRLLWSVIGSMPSSYIKAWSNESEAAFLALPKQPDEAAECRHIHLRVIDGKTFCQRCGVPVLPEEAA